MTKLTPEDIASLDDGQWLTDNVIRKYSEIAISGLPEEKKRVVYVAEPTFFSVISAMRTENRLNIAANWLEDEKVLERERIIIPVHDTRRNHWALVIVFVQDRQIVAYDSVASIATADLYTTTVGDWLRYVEKRATGQCGEWNLAVGHVGQQRNPFDCGAYLLAFAAQVLVHGNVVQKDVDCSQVRRIVKKALLTTEKTK